MITINISPVAFRIGSVAVTWYGIMVMLAIIAVVVFSAYNARRYGITREQIYTLALFAVVSGIIGARLVHVIDYWSYYSAHPGEIFGFAGFGVWGAIIGAALATGVYAWHKRILFWSLGDAIAPGAVLGQAIGRLGCVFNGCCYGIQCDLPWAFVWEDPQSFAPVGVPVHPTQVYLLLWNLVVFGLLLGFRGRLKTPGTIFLLYLIAYSAGDFGIRFLREGQETLAGFLQAQVISLGVFAIAVGLIIYRMRRVRRAVTAEVKAGSERSQGD